MWHTWRQGRATWEWLAGGTVEVIGSEREDKDGSLRQGNRTSAGKQYLES